MGAEPRPREQGSRSEWPLCQQPLEGGPRPRRTAAKARRPWRRTRSPSWGSCSRGGQRRLCEATDAAENPGKTVYVSLAPLLGLLSRSMAKQVNDETNSEAARASGESRACSPAGGTQPRPEPPKHTPGCQQGQARLGHSSAAVPRTRASSPGHGLLPPVTSSTAAWRVLPPLATAG